MNPATGEIEDTDLCARLSTAIEKVYLHLRDHPGVAVRVEVSYDADGELEGVGFFDPAHNLISCVTVYRLERDNEVPTIAAIEDACRKDGPAFEQQLNEIFRA